MACVIDIWVGGLGSAYLDLTALGPIPGPDDDIPEEDPNDLALPLYKAYLESRREKDREDSISPSGHPL